MMTTKNSFLLYFLVMTFLLTFVFVMMARRSIAESKATRWKIINQRLVFKKEKGYSYAKTYQRLRQCGMSERYKDPVYYFTTKSILGLIFGGVLYVVNPLLSVVGFALGFLAFDWYVTARNKGDNEKITADIETIYNILSIQLQNGVYVGDAFVNIKEILTNKRVKDALEEFTRHYKMGDLTLKENLADFEDKFQNEEISALCMIINQADDSGRSKNIMTDLVKQIEAMEEIRMSHQKEKINNILTIAMMVLFSDFMAFLFYLFMTNISSVF